MEQVKVDKNIQYKLLKAKTFNEGNLFVKLFYLWELKILTLNNGRYIINEVIQAVLTN